SDIQQTNDGGYIIAGTRNGYGSVGLIKTDSTGEEEWNQAFGGDSYEYGRSVKQTNDGGYIVVGQSNSFGGADYDVYLIKTDSAGVE
ncbi:MAG: hypothetical protein RAP03_20785, partial [Candidatus Electryonea clarkiae]|nr:hypothetical protein [Candidatus Electryonea clarkiae]